jgi:outer membrane beta-barrel protein
MKKLMLLFLTLPFIINAKVIQRFDEDDLPAEVVSPKLDSPDAVQKRRILLKGKFEFGSNFVNVLNEPFSLGKGLNLSAGYHITENSSLHLRYTGWAQGQSDYSLALRQDSQKLRFDRVPQAQSTITLNGEYAFYYGKISLDRGLIFRTTMFAESGFGQTLFGTKNYLGIHAGFGQKIFFNKNFAFRVSLDYQNQQIPNPFSSDIKEASPIPDESAFAQTSRHNSVLGVGVVGVF